MNWLRYTNDVICYRPANYALRTVQKWRHSIDQLTMHWLRYKNDVIRLTSWPCIDYGTQMPRPVKQVLFVGEYQKRCGSLRWWPPIDVTNQFEAGKPPTTCYSRYVRAWHVYYMTEYRCICYSQLTNRFYMSQICNCLLWCVFECSQSTGNRRKKWPRVFLA